MLPSTDTSFTDRLNEVGKYRIAVLMADEIVANFLYAKVLRTANPFHTLRGVNP